MKKVKYVITTFCCLIFIVFCGFSIACELKGNFFDKVALKTCEIEFLQKPENVTNEKYYFEGYWKDHYSAGDDWYEYTCEIGSLSEYHNYAKSILQGFIDNNYTFGYMDEIVYLGDMLTSYMRYFKIYPSINIDDYDIDYGRYRFFYTKKPYNKLKEKFGGKFMGHRELFMKINDEKNENGKYEMCMRMYGGNSKSEWGNYFFEKE